MSKRNFGNEQKKAKIALEDGRVFEGFSFGAEGERYGEIVFNTSMAGYQEILTDPSYRGQIVTMTYPLIGNYGVNKEDVESWRPFAEGFVVKEASRLASNWRSRQKLDTYLKQNNIVGIEGVDTRAITKHIRLQGAMKAVISTGDLNDKSLIKKARSSPGLIGRDLVKDITTKGIKYWQKKGKYKVVVIDLGVKFNILRQLAANGCSVVLVPADITAEEIFRIKPDGILISNGPGDPEGIPYVVETAKKLIGKLPIFGICFGQQILGLAFGGKTYKLKFGHHGGNQPVKDLETGRVHITVQNHGFCVDIKSLNARDIEITHVNLNDATLEGMRHRKLPIFSVQFHPEAGPGPHDARYLFKEFVKMMETNRAKKN
ncbi:MAG: glutamine-hydrolyzing carbamoyl-phosphate synthase small subunit [Candidatus Omnitrophota bacterium]|nr:glutamine-hydrolyzing carbamoyl-phosphate synthase small subunit [Candidatus Omnitrophota bacterium]